MTATLPAAATGAAYGQPPSPAAARPGTVAEALARCSRRLLGADLPVRVRAWDGSVVGPPSSPTTIVIESPERPAPDALRARRARASAGPTWPATSSLDGDIFDLLAVRDRLGAASDHVEVGIGLEGRPGAVPDGTPARRLRTARSPRPRRRPGSRAGATRPPATGPPSPTTTTWATTSTGSSSARASPTPARTGPVTGRHAGGGPGRQVRARVHQARAAARACACSTSAAGGAAWRSTRPSTTASTVVGITLSKEQRRLAADRAAEAGLGRPGRVPRAGLPRHRRRPVRRGQQHRHVRARRRGPHRRVHGAASTSLVRPGGRLLNHAISRPPGAVGDPRPLLHRPVRLPRRCADGGGQDGVGDARRPGSRCATSSRSASTTRSTLRAWTANLEAGWDRAVRLVGPGRARVWRLYMAASAVNFEQGRTSLHQVLGVRPHPDGRADMPLTRRELLRLTRPPPVSAYGSGCPGNQFLRRIEGGGGSLHPPAMSTLVLLRHGESTWNAENLFTGWWDVDLTACR